jgi:hypothetical protein
MIGGVVPGSREIVERPWRSISAAAACALVLAACTVGSGEVISESRPVTDFREVVLAGSGDVEIGVTGAESLRVEAEENILPLLTTEVVSGRLELGSSEPFTTSEGVSYVITAQTITGVIVAGSGTVTVTGIDSDVFRAVISGSGTIDVSGSCGVLDVTVAGSGDFDGAGLACATGTVSVPGSADVVVDVSDELDVTVAGSGDVNYIGDPVVRSRITGSGSVSER